jgi:tetratricopeptide (TPR) repeat protein
MFMLHRVPSLLAFVVVLGCVYLLLSRRQNIDQTPPAAAPAPLNAVAVLPFVADCANLPTAGESIAQLLSIRVDGSAGLHRLDPWVVLDYVDRKVDGPLDAERARGVATGLAARFFITGRIQERDEHVSIDATLHDVEQRSQAFAEVHAAGELAHLPAVVDELASTLLQTQPRAAEVKVARLSAVTSDQISALRAYLEGESAARGNHPTQAIAALQRAVEEDPGFALAHYRLARVAEWTHATSLAGDAMQQAVLLSNRLPEHDRLVLNARLAARRGDPADAERLYRRLIAADESDWEAWLGLIEVGNTAAVAREASERLQALLPGQVQLIERSGKLGTRADKATQ